MVNGNKNLYILPIPFDFTFNLIVQPLATFLSAGRQAVAYAKDRDEDGLASIACLLQIHFMSCTAITSYQFMEITNPKYATHTGASLTYLVTLLANPPLLLQ